MKLVPIAKRDDHFNHEAAEAARQWVLDDPEFALAVLPFWLHERVQNEIYDHYEPLQKSLDLVYGPRLEALSKAAGGDYFDLRDKRGQFARGGTRRTKIDYRHAGGKLPSVPKGHQLRGNDAKRYALAYDQVHREVQHALDSGFDPADSYVTAVYRDARGNPSVRNTVGMDSAEIVHPRHFANGGRLHELTLRDQPPLSVGGAGYDLADAVSNPRVAAELGPAYARTTGGMLSHTNAGTTAARLGGYDERNPADTSSGRAFNRLRALGDLATQVMGEHAPSHLKLAAHVATAVGEYGPEAEKVLGPSTRRTAYRYRGVEKKPDPALQRAIDESIIRARKTRNGTEEDTPAARTAAREAVIYGHRNDRGQHAESQLIQYFQQRLPDPDLYDLQRKSGTIPPSQGVIVDRHGRVAHEAVCYGDDWYLPFNLKNLRALKGGEYVRTRAYGGLTTEDIYTGLVSGARSVTVVSNSGVFTLEFDDNFRGGRRLNDKAARMVSRYGHLLDAVGSGDVTPGQIEASRMAELEAKAADVYDPVTEKKQYDARLDELKSREQLNPQLSGSVKAKIRDEALDEAAADYASRNGLSGVHTLADLAAHERVATLRHLPRYPGEPEAEHRARAEARVAEAWGTPEAAAETLGATRRIKAAESAALKEQQERVTALQLNGVGYDFAGRALREQFPYYIARYSSRDRRGRTDEGYVKPRFVRPRGAKAGYYDTSITGRGKVSADRTGYQNHGVARGAEREQDEAARPPVPREREAAPAPAEKKPEEGLSALAARRQAVFAGAAAVRNAEQISPAATGTFLNRSDHAGMAIDTDEAKKLWRGEFPALTDPDFERKFDDPAFQAKALREMRRVADLHLVDHDFSAALDAPKAAKPGWSLLDSLSRPDTPPEADYGEEFNHVEADPAESRRHFLRLLERDEKARMALHTRKIEKGDDEDETGFVDALPRRILSERAKVLAEHKELEERKAAADRSGGVVAAPKDAAARLATLRATLEGLDRAHEAARKAKASQDAMAVPGEVVTEERHHPVVADSPAGAQHAAAAARALGATVVAHGETPFNLDELLGRAKQEHERQQR